MARDACDVRDPPHSTTTHWVGCIKECYNSLQGRRRGVADLPNQSNRLRIETESRRGRAGARRIEKQNTDDDDDHCGERTRRRRPHGVLLLLRKELDAKEKDMMGGPICEKNP
jgi:hypothetical protein